MTAHTKGPWHFTPNDDLHKIGVYAGGPDEIIICDVTDEDDLSSSSQETLIANARLIASAPAMLAKLEQTARILRERLIVASPWGMSLVESIEAEIAKAKGATS